MQELSTHWLYPLNVQNDFHFNSSARDFIVEEIPLYEFSGEGEHLVLKIRKKDMTTWEMLDTLASHLGIKKREIGYAGLKDKNAMTMQYISILKKYQERLESFNHPQIKIVEEHIHNNKIRLGHLKGNRFSIRLKKVLGVQKDKIESTLKWIATYGVPNYFGVQRFGNSGENWSDGKAILEGTLKIRDKTKREFLINAYQSYLFNNWLSRRIELSLLLEKFSENEVEQIMELEKGALAHTKKQPHFFKLVEGDLMMHYPHGRLFELESLESEAKRFMERDIAPTGLLSGKKTNRSTLVAKDFEEGFDRELETQGGRRYAWIFVEAIEGKYIEEKAHYELSFVLPKGCYATNVLDVLRGK
ncbi:MAG: tRNA pseudouridine(13) synthase TruD [Campylobacterales bacterium]|nr:tRNA pseudouridine(13) synthase TruD [Campylobacterales bacterium]